MIVVLKDLIELLRMEHEIEIRDAEGNRLFGCSSNSQALKPYYDREVIEWFAFVGLESKVCITIGEEL